MLFEWLLWCLGAVGVSWSVWAAAAPDLTGSTPDRSPDPAEVFPRATWDTAAPEAVGLDSESLQRLAEFIGGRGCVVRFGKMVTTWGDVARRADVASAAKPVYAHFLFLAVVRSRIPSVDEPVVHWEPRLATLNPDLGFKDGQITWRHLANQTACYGVREKPGTAFDYNDWQMALFWDTLFLKVYGATYESVDVQVLRPLLTDRIQCQDDPTFLAFGPKDRPGRLAISVRDFARFGLLYLRGGRWGSEQLLPAEWVRRAVSSPLPNSIPRTRGEPAQMIPGQRSIGSRRIPDDQTDHGGSYSWLWWVNGIDREGRRHWPGVPPSVFAALGHGGVRGMAVFPDQQLILSWNDGSMRQREAVAEAFRRLLAALRPESPATASRER